MTVDTQRIAIYLESKMRTKLPKSEGIYWPDVTWSCLIRLPPLLEASLALPWCPIKCQQVPFRHRWCPEPAFWCEPSVLHLDNSLHHHSNQNRPRRHLSLLWHREIDVILTFNSQVERRNRKTISVSLDFVRGIDTTAGFRVWMEFAGIKIF